MNPDLFLLFDALAVATAAAVMDVQQHRIPNWLTYPVMLAGVLLRSYYFGWNGLLTAVGGCLLAGGIVFLFYAVRAMGAGDLKLLAALGSLAGPRYAIRFFWLRRSLVVCWPWFTRRCVAAPGKLSPTSVP